MSTKTKKILAVACWIMVILAWSMLTANNVIDDDTVSVSAVKSVREMAERNGVKATFAAIARNVERNPGLAEYLRDCVAAGHEIASHSYSHGADVWSRSNPGGGYADAMEKDLEKAAAVFDNLIVEIASVNRL